MMRYYTLNELASGMRLGSSIYSSNGNLLLASGKPLDMGFITRIGELGFPGVYIDEPGFESIEPPELIDPSLRASTHVLMGECLKSLTKLSPIIQEFDGSLDERLTAHPEFERALPMGEIQEKVYLIIDDLMEQFAMELPCLLIKAQSRYQVEHAVDTMLISVLLGINFRFIYRELRQLGLAALLHDVGKPLLAKPGEKNVGPDHPRYKDHPILGGLIVLGNGTNHYTEAAAIQQHHERQDGKGFPTGLIGYNKAPLSGRTHHTGTIFRLAEIISVADAYDVLTSGAYQAPLSPEQTIQRLVNRSFFEFNAETVRMLTRVVQIFPVGCQVRILKCSDEKLKRSRGVVAKANSEYPNRVDLILTHDSAGSPVKPELISLSEDESVRLEILF